MFAKMVSRDLPGVVANRHRFVLDIFQATPADCRLVGLKVASPAEQRAGFKTKFYLRWDTPKGYRIYRMYTDKDAAVVVAA